MVWPRNQSENTISCQKNQIHNIVELSGVCGYDMNVAKIKCTQIKMVFSTLVCVCSISTLTIDFELVALDENGSQQFPRYFGIVVRLLVIFGKKLSDNI